MRGRGNTASGLLALALLFVPSIRAEDIYKWTDEQGRVHYSNRGGEGAQAEPSDTPAGGEGWESALERKRGTEEFTAASDSAINSLQARMIRRKRERGRAQETLEAIQADIVRAQASNPNAVPELRARETTQLGEVRKLDVEIANVESQIARLRAFKALGRDHPEKPTPFGQ